MANIAIYKFNDGTDTLPLFESSYTYSYTDESNGDGTITRTITSDTVPTSISFKDLEGLVNKIERMQIQKEKKPSDSINAVLPIEEYGPFPLEVEKVLRENVIDNMDDLLTRKINLDKTTTDTRNYIEFMKKFYDFSSMDKKNNLTKTK